PADPRVQVVDGASGPQGIGAARRARRRVRFVIDLHTHTTASDGNYAPADLVARAAAAGITTLAVTDHDTLAGCEAASVACAAKGLTFVPGIEVTSVCDGKDLHVLGYFVDPASPALRQF